MEMVSARDGTMMRNPAMSCDVAVVGGGPAGLMAADVLSSQGLGVHLFDRMPSVGRKFLLAGKGGMNLTHSESFEVFVQRYGDAQQVLRPILAAFDNQAVRAWASSLGVETFVGSSGRVFPVDMKAAPLLRAWLRSLRDPAQGRVPVTFHQRHHWTGWENDLLVFQTGTGAMARVKPRATVLALGGASWPQLGSDGAWVPVLAETGVDLSPLLPSNCGFDVSGGWTPVFAQRFAGSPLKSVVVRVRSAASSSGDRSAAALAGLPPLFDRRGEFVVTQTGIEGSVVYAASACLRDQIRVNGSVTLEVDLLPDWTPERVSAAVHAPRGSRSLSSHLKGRLGLEGVKTGLLYEKLGPDGMKHPDQLAHAIKALPLVLCAPRPVAEAISTAGGIRLEGITTAGDVRPLKHVFCAGEMLDWEAPTGGYLLTACLATGRWAGLAAADSLRRRFTE